MGANSTHGTYDWVPDFFKINYVNANMTMNVIHERYSNLTIVEHVEEVSGSVQQSVVLEGANFSHRPSPFLNPPPTKYGGSYQERVQALRTHCNTVIRVDNDVSKDEKRYVPLLEVAYPPPPFFLPV